jgi:hypothetical protein
VFNRCLILWGFNVNSLLLTWRFTVSIEIKYFSHNVYMLVKSGHWNKRTYEDWRQQILNLWKAQRGDIYWTTEETRIIVQSV